MIEKIKLGIYKHYKGDKYNVLHTGYNTRDKEEIIIYQSLVDNRIWVRFRKEFFGKIEIDGKKINRFEYIGEVENDNLENKYKRALADYQNLLKQTVKEKTEFIKFANERALYEILPIYDNLKTSIKYIDEEAKKNNWAVGIEYIIKQFSDVLKNFGITEIITEKEKFDHNLMEAIDNEETDDKNKDSFVAKEVKSGYILHGKVIMPAKVIVYKIKNNN